MKAKALRFKDTKEFVSIQFFGEEPIVGSCDLPTIQPMTATISGMKNVYENEDMEDLFDFDNMEFVEVDIIDAGEVGADIRNKLTPPLNLVSLLKLYFKETDEEKKMTLEKYIKKEMKQSEKSVKYIANLL